MRGDGAATAPLAPAVVICTRDRPEKVARTFDALARQSDPGFEVVVVVQGDSEAWASGAAPLGELPADRCRVVRDGGVGLSRARNIGCRNAAADWIVYLDDDCVPAAGWMTEIKHAIHAHPEASMISGDVREDRPRPPRDYVRVSVAEVDRERTVRGRFNRPWEAGFGVNFAVRRQAIVDLGGFDERLGPGVPDFPAADDMDFNYRLLRSGRIAYVTPRIRAVHEQWRSPDEVVALWRGYARAWAGMAMKQLRSGDPAGAAWLWPMAARDVLGMAWSAIRLRSALRARVALAILVGMLAGTLRGVVRRW